MGALRAAFSAHDSTYPTRVAVCIAGAGAARNAGAVARVGSEGWQGLRGSGAFVVAA